MQKNISKGTTPEASGHLVKHQTLQYDMRDFNVLLQKIIIQFDLKFALSKTYYLMYASLIVTQLPIPPLPNFSSVLHFDRSRYFSVNDGYDLILKVVNKLILIFSSPYRSFRIRLPSVNINQTSSLLSTRRWVSTSLMPFPIRRPWNLKIIKIPIKRIQFKTRVETVTMKWQIATCSRVEAKNGKESDKASDAILQTAQQLDFGY